MLINLYFTLLKYKNLLKIVIMLLIAGIFNPISTFSLCLCDGTDNDSSLSENNSEDNKYLGLYLFFISISLFFIFAYVLPNTDFVMFPSPTVEAQAQEHLKEAFIKWMEQATIEELLTLYVEPDAQKAINEHFTPQQIAKLKFLCNKYLK